MAKKFALVSCVEGGKILSCPLQNKTRRLHVLNDGRWQKWELPPGFLGPDVVLGYFRVPAEGEEVLGGHVKVSFLPE